jgi:hypothetical protein
MIRVDDDALEAMVNAFLNLIERDLNLNEQRPPGYTCCRRPLADVRFPLTDFSRNG